MPLLAILRPHGCSIGYRTGHNPAGRAFHIIISHRRYCMKFTILTLVLVVSSTLFAQLERTKEEVEREKAYQEKAAKATADSLKKYGWTHEIVTGLNLSEVAFKDWAQGGANSLAYTLWLQGSSVQDIEKYTWSNSYKAAFGQARLSDQGLRKTDDEIYFETLLIYKLGTLINPYASATLRTQFAKGFVYNNNVESPVSSFFDPAYMTQSIGVAYKPATVLTTRLGVGVREIITSEFTAYAGDPTTTKVEKIKIRGGLESVTELLLPLAENMSFSSKLELFDAFTNMDQLIVRSDNTLAAKVNKYVTVNVNFQLINDVNVSPRSQIKQALALGLSYSLL